MSERGEVVAWQCQWGGACPDYHDEFDPIPKEWDGPPDVITPLVRQSDYLALREELEGAEWESARQMNALYVRIGNQARTIFDLQAELAALKARIAESKPAWVLGDELYFTEATAIEAVKHWGPSAGIAERVRLLVEDA